MGAEPPKSWKKRLKTKPSREDSILKSEVESAIKRLKNTRPDRVELVKEGGPRVADEVLKICSKIWEAEK